MGSEGLDFQLCHILVNYDLRWNPMVVEQRIGRLDRFGQTAEKLLTFNFRQMNLRSADAEPRLFRHRRSTQRRYHGKQIGPKIGPTLEDRLHQNSKLRLLQKKEKPPRRLDLTVPSHGSHAWVAMQVETKFLRSSGKAPLAITLMAGASASCHSGLSIRIFHPL